MIQHILQHWIWLMNRNGNLVQECRFVQNQLYSPLNEKGSNHVHELSHVWLTNEFLKFSQEIYDFLLTTGYPVIKDIIRHMSFFDVVNIIDESC